MIAGILHSGSGVGDQLHRYITVRTLAEEKGYQWGMIGQDNFKGNFFSNFDLGLSIFDMPGKKWEEKDVRENGVDIRSYDPEINFVKDDTVLDGYFEDEKYWGHNLDNIREWLAVEPIEVPRNVCVIGFRGGEYYTDPNLGLPREYFAKAIEMMRKKGINKFEVHTDDPNTAKLFFPNFPIIQNVGLNWRSVRYARNLIISNSAFYIMPALLNEGVEEVIAPRFWARYNTKTWARPATFYKKFHYIHHDEI